MERQLNQAILDQFVGSERQYRHAMTRIHFTDGVKYVAEAAGAWWLVDELASVQKLGPHLDRHPFQVWKLERDRTGRKATLTCEDGNGRQLYRKRIDYTDFPRPSFTLWLADGVILLPTEY
jgi:hypothetical protein